MTQAHSKEWELQYRRVGQNHLAASAAYTILRQDCVCSTQHPEHTEKYWFIITIWHQFTTSPCCWLRISRLSKGNQHHAKSCAADVTEVGVQMRANPNVCPDQAPQPQKHVARRLVCGSKSHQEMMRRKNRKKNTWPWSKAPLQTAKPMETESRSNTLLAKSLGWGAWGVCLPLRAINTTMN